MKKKSKIALRKYVEYQFACDRLAEEAQAKIDFGEDISCTYIDGDGICLSAEVPYGDMLSTSACVCPVDVFFEFAEGKEIVTAKEFRSLCI